MSTDPIIVQDAGEFVDLRMHRSPSQVLIEAQAAADALAKFAHEKALYKQIGPSKHLMVEGWQMVAAMFGVVTSITETRYVDLGNGVHGYEATAIAVLVSNGREIGRAESMCLSDEDNWGMRPKYETPEGGGKRTKVGDVPTPLFQLRSMAQTRAQANVLESKFRWIAKLGGFAGTASENMTEGKQNPNAGHTPPQAKGENADNFISEPQKKRLYAMGMTAFKQDKDAFFAYLARNGFPSGQNIPKDRYDELCAGLDADK
jgi:hypothetical protein